MAHVHDHNDSSYFLEQLCTIGVCGALGGVVIIMWYIPNGLTFLGPQFQAPFGKTWLSPVLWGGVAVVTMVLIRAVAVWISVGKARHTQQHSHNHDHSHHHDHAHCDHDHGHDHHHDHEHQHADEAVMAAPAAITSSPATAQALHMHDHDHAHEHDHDLDHAHNHDHVHEHGHEHGWAPWRYVVLLLPVGLYFLGLIPSAFSNLGTVRTDFEEGGPSAAAKGGEVIRGFLELGRAAATEESRKEYEGRTAQVVGQANNVESRRFGLVRYKISCCAADAVPLKMVISVPATTPEGKAFDAKSSVSGKWVEVTGVIQFRKLQGSDEYITVLEVPANKVNVLPKPPDNSFVY